MKAILFIILLLSFGASAQNQPTLYFGSAKNGENISGQERLISIRDNTTGNFLPKQRIVSFTLSIDDNTIDTESLITKKGALLLDKTSKHLQAAPSGTIIIIMVKVRCSSGIGRTIMGAFKIE